MIITDLTPILDTLYETKMPLLLLSSPGIGKSSVINQFAVQNDLQLIEVRGASANPSELADIKYVSKNEVLDAPQAWFPTEEKVRARKCSKNGIIFLDEIADSLPAVQSTLQRLFLDRKLGSLTLPTNWWVAAASNKQSHKAAANRLSTALLNRALVVNLEPDPDALFEYLATKPDVHPVVLGYLRLRPDCLQDSAADSLKQELPQFCSPRSLHRAGQFLHSIEGKEFPDHLLLETLSGFIGEGRGSELYGFIKLADELPPIELVFNDPKTCPIPQNTDAQIAVIYGVLGNMDEDQAITAAHYFTRFPVEVSVVAIKDLFRKFGPKTKQVLSTDPEIMEWMIENFKFVF